MASTSLRRQVDALRHASSGTSSGYIQRKKGKPSLLLTPDQAADVDLSSVRETAVMGLQRLEAVDQNFSAFQETLFSKDAENTLRDLQTKESNERIDKSITSFLHLLSPHFSSREAHFCLEYLIRHYKVYQYNVDAVVECCLPWHDTVAFARLVQLLSLKGTRWEFLTPVQKTGSPLPREAIARRCARDFGLLRFLCVSARRYAAAAAGSSATAPRGAGSGGFTVSAATASGRAKLFSFYAAVVVEALASLGTASEALLRALVPTVVHGLSASKSPEYQMASYMILSALAGKGPLSSEVTATALTALVCKPCQGGLEPSLLCALAVAQAQIGFFPKQSSSSTKPLFLPTSAFMKLSRMESLAEILAGLAEKFDATAFLWLLLQSYVQHLSDKEKGGEHCASLIRMCAYPHWPSHSFPRLVRRLVDRLIKSYLGVTIEGAVEGEDEGERKRSAASMKEECQKVLRILGQRFPQDMDAAVGKLTRHIAKSKNAAKVAVVALEGVDGDEESERERELSKTARRETLRGEALSSLLGASFAGAQMVQRLPLEDAELSNLTDEGVTSFHVIYSSLMVALEHPSGVVRARAVEQLSLAMSKASTATDVNNENGHFSTSDENLTPAIIRRLHDEDPDVVLGVTGSNVLLEHILLSQSSRSLPLSNNRSAKQLQFLNEEVTGLSDTTTTASAVLVKAVTSAAGYWLAALSETRPKHSVASAGRVLCGLLRCASAAVKAESSGGGEGGQLDGNHDSTRDAALRLFLECLPGPHANARVKLARHLAVALASQEDSKGNAAGAAFDITGRACKKATRSVGRAAIEALCSLEIGSVAVSGSAGHLFFGLGKALENCNTESVGKKRSNGSKLKRDDVKGEENSKGLKAMGEEVCKRLAVALVAENDVKFLQVMGERSGPGARWLLLEIVFRAVALASSTCSTPSNKSASPSENDNTARLSSLLAGLSTFELFMRPGLLSSVSENCEADGAFCAAEAADLLRYLQACAPHLSRTSRPSSLFGSDHLSGVNDSPGAGGLDASQSGGENVEFRTIPSPLLGDVLVSVLRATGSTSDYGVGGCKEVSQALSAVVLRGYGGRPLPALAAMAIMGVSTVRRASNDLPHLQHRRSRGKGNEVVTGSYSIAAPRALCVAATFVKAAAEATITQGEQDEGSNSGLERVKRDVVSVFPAALLAVSSDSKCLRDAGMLLITTIANHGRSLGTRGGDSQSDKTEDSNLFPLSSHEGGGKKKPSPFSAPPLSSVLDLAQVLAERHNESALDGAELTRHLATVLGVNDQEESESIEITPKPKLDCNARRELSRYLVGWAARLGWRNPSASARLLECLAWDVFSMRACCLPLFWHSLDSETIRNNPENARLLKLLLEVALSHVASDDDRAQSSSPPPPKSAKKSLLKTPDSGNNFSDDHKSPSQAAVFATEEAEELLHQSLRISGPPQNLALKALSSFASASSNSSTPQSIRNKSGPVIESTIQRTRLVRTLVEIGLDGADSNLVAEAARAVSVRPSDLAAIVSELSFDEVATKTRKKSKPHSTQKTDTCSWCFILGGVVELAQSLCGPSNSFSTQSSQQNKKSRNRNAPSPGHVSLDSAKADTWSGLAPLVLTRPLFDILPKVLAVVRSATPQTAKYESRGETVNAVAAAEYALWLTMDVIGNVLRRLGPTFKGDEYKQLYDGTQAGEDAGMVLNCIRENPSPQTRNSALSLLSGMATLFPAAMASRLRSLLDAVCSTPAAFGEGAGASGVDIGVGGGGKAALRQTQRAVQSVVPALKAHGAEAGVGAYFVIQVFVDALGDAPVHSQRALYQTLVGSLGEDSLAILSAVLLRRSLTCDDAISSNSLAGKDAITAGSSSKIDKTYSSSMLVEFVHQTVHCSGARMQVKALVGLVQACHRLSVHAASLSGNFSGQGLEDAIDAFVNPDVEEETEDVDYMNLPLGVQPKDEKKPSSGPCPTFMSIDLRALLSASKTGDDVNLNEMFLEKTLSFVRDHLLSKPLLMAVATAADRAERDPARSSEADEEVQEGFLLLCEELLLLIKTLGACEQGSSKHSSLHVKGSCWVILQSLAYSVFETLQSLLSVPSFVAVTQELLQHQDPHLRRKALQMFTRRLDPASGDVPRLSPGEEALFVDMIPSLRAVTLGMTSLSRSSSTPEEKDGSVEPMNDGDQEGSDSNTRGDVEEESAVNRQTALLSLDVLARVLGRRHQLAFVGVLDDVTEIVAGKGPNALPGCGEVDGETSIPLRASAFLLLATLCAVLGVRAFPRLPRFFPAMLGALESHSHSFSASRTSTPESKGGQGLLWTSALSAVATVAASLPSFLSPYLKRILAITLQPFTSRGAAGPRSAGKEAAADRVLSLLAAGVEPRLLIPAVCGVYVGCVTGMVDGDSNEHQVCGSADSVARLLAYVQEILGGLDKEAVSAALPQFTRLLTQALDFRRLYASGSAPQVRASADLVETEATSALVSLVMKLSEFELRPLFLHLCEWKAAVSGDDPKAILGGLDRRLSFYRVLDGLATALKSIFTPYFAHVLADCCNDMRAAADVLSTTTTIDSSSLTLSGSVKRKRSKKDDSQYQAHRKRGRASSGAPTSDVDSQDLEDDDDDEPATSDLAWRLSNASRLILSALRRCFQSDRSGFVDRARFELLLPAVVSQLECGSDYSAETTASNVSTAEAASYQLGAETSSEGDVASCRLHAEEVVGPCLAQLASASGKDALWKSLANAALMKTRSERAGVRVAALVSLRQSFEVVGEEFLALLPECLPFLSELLEDGHPEVESECRALVKYIEGVLGESIESYLV